SVSIVQSLCFRENAFGAVLINIKTKDCAPEFGAHDDVSRADRSVFGRGLSRGKASETEQCCTNDAAYKTIRVFHFFPQFSILIPRCGRLQPREHVMLSPIHMCHTLVRGL